MAVEAQKCTPEHSAESWSNKTLHTARVAAASLGNSTTASWALKIRGFLQFTSC